MPEIDRVYSAITAFFESSGEVKPQDLSDAVGHCILDAYRRFLELRMEDGDLSEEIIKIRIDLEALIADMPADRSEKIAAFKEISRRAMLARRATYPLVDRERPWESLTPEEALNDETDAFSFSIFDSLADKISALAPALYQLAVEGDWEEKAESGDDDS